MTKKTETIKKTTPNISMLKPGQIIDGRIINIEENNVFVDLGPYKTGILPGREFKENKEIIKNLKIGDQISAMVIDPENEDGYAELSLKEAYYKRAWESLRELKDGGFSLKVKILQANRGGLIVSVKGISGFMPVSQLSSNNYPCVEHGDINKIVSELNKFVNQEMEVKIIDINEREQKLIVSEKSLEEEKMKGILEQYKIGDIIEGEVSGVTDFGAFVKIPIGETRVEGLIHIAEMDWQLVSDPRKILSPNDKIKAKIIGLDGNRLSLSLKALQPDPWEELSEEKYKKGDIIKGKVVKINPYGAFVEVEKNIYGLIHISELANVGENKNNLELGKKYKFKIIFFNPKAHKITLSLAE